MTANEIREWHKAFERQDVTAEVARARARIEIAAQLAELNENIANLRNHQIPFPVQIEPGQYPIVTEIKK